MQIADAIWQIRRRAVPVGYERERVPCGDLRVHVEFPAILERTHGVSAAAGRSFDPPQVLAVAMAAHESEEGRSILVPGPMDAAATHLLVIDRHRHHEEGDVI